MNNFNPFLLVVLMLLLASCATKELYRFGTPAGNFADNSKVEKQGLHVAEVKAPNLVSAANPTHDITFSASLETNTGMAAATKLPQPVRFQPEIQLKKSGKHAVKSFRSSLKKPVKVDYTSDDKPGGNKRVHQLAKLGFIFSLAGVLLHVVGLTILGVGSGYLVLAFFTAIAAVVLSWLGRKQIKENPEKYAGKGWAMAGFLIGSLQLLFYLIFLLAAIAWSAAYV